MRGKTMSETCCYCGNDREETPAIHADWVGHAFVVRQAERGALGAAHDASVAAFEAQICELHTRVGMLLRDPSNQRRVETAATLIESIRREAVGLVPFYAELKRVFGDAESAEAHLAERDAVIRRGIDALMGPRFAALERAANVWERRALAAEAQLATAEAAGARALLDWLTCHMGDTTVCHGDYETIALSEDRGHDAVLAAWQAAQETEG